MRKILFRAKRIAVRDWVEGFYVHVPKGRWDGEEHLIQPIKEDGRVGTLRNIDPETLGQFTGLTDMNGKKIFEGDIVRYMNKETMVVSYRNESASFVGTYSAINFNYCASLMSANLYLEVIGNIHDNPEMLEEK